MKKKIVLITFCLGLIPILITLLEISKYSDYQNDINHKSKQIQKEIKKIDSDLIEKNAINDKIKMENVEKIKVLELWKKRLEKIKN